MKICAIGIGIIKILAMVRDEGDRGNLCVRIHAANHIVNKMIHVANTVVI